MKLSHMRAVLDERGIRLSKSLGQNFLHDANQLRRIVAAAELVPADRVLEIGPGLGPLTELLVSTAVEVVAVEKDRRLVEFLQQHFRAAGNLRLVHADALQWLQEQRRDWSNWKLVANLPYSVASPLLVEFAQTAHPPERMTVTLQLEVARRLMASAGDGDYGLLTLLVQAGYAARDSFRIPPGCFFPEPEVDSACVTLCRREQPLVEGAQRPLFAKLVRRAFSQRRKTMLKLLKQDWPAAQLEELFAQRRLPKDVRAEAVPLETFAALARGLAAEPNRP